MGILLPERKDILGHLLGW